MSAAPALPLHDLQEFFLENGRLPRIGDPVAPWEYRGWLLPYVMEIHRLHPAIPDRWGYHLATLDAGRLLDAPIPKIQFQAPEKAVTRELEKWIEILEYRSGSWSGFREFLDWMTWALAVSKEEPRIDVETNEKLYRAVNVGPMLLAPWDYLGALLSERKANGWNPTAFYPTPHNVVEMMVQMTMHDAKLDGRDPRTATVCDPCVGTGRMLLHASNYSLCLYGMDIDALVLAICRINGALYAPWLSFPLPHEIVGDHIPDPPPAPLPLPEEHQPPENVIPFRVDDRGQGLLF